MTTTTTTITYKELARRLDSIFLFNKAPELDAGLYESIENGSPDYCINHENCTGEQGDECEMYQKDVFQWYLITPSDAEYIKGHTDELIFYSYIFDEYIWGVTHWGTSWDGVELEFKENKGE